MQHRAVFSVVDLLTLEHGGAVGWQAGSLGEFAQQGEALRIDVGFGIIQQQAVSLG